MARESSIRSVIITLSKASFLLIVVFAFIFLFAFSLQDSSVVFPNDAQLMNKVLTIYGITFALVLTTAAILIPREVKNLARANYWKGFTTRFLPKAVVYGLILIAIKSIFTGPNHVGIFGAILKIPVGTLLVHLFVVSEFEEITFGGLLYTIFEKKGNKKAANIITIIVFPLWHLVKSAGNIVLMFIYVPLRIWWNYERNHGTILLNRIPGIGPRLFGPTPATQQANAGAHFSWNAFVIGFIEPFQI